MNIDNQKRILVQQREDLERELSSLGRKDSQGSWVVVPDEGDGDYADAIDNADITEDYEEKIARLEVLEAQHAQVEKALKAIKKGTYGICEVSGEKIPEERLKAYPSATTTKEHAK